MGFDETDALMNEPILVIEEILLERETILAEHEAYLLQYSYNDTEETL